MFGRRKMKNHRVAMPHHDGLQIITRQNELGRLSDWLICDLMLIYRLLTVHCSALVLKCGRLSCCGPTFHHPSPRGDRMSVRTEAVVTAHVRAPLFLACNFAAAPASIRLAKLTVASCQLELPHF